MGDANVKDTTVSDRQLTKNKSHKIPVRNEKTNGSSVAIQKKIVKPQTYSKPDSAGRGASAVTLSKPTTATNKSKFSFPVAKRNQGSDDPMHTSRSMIPSPKTPIGRTRSKSHLELIPSLKPSQHFNNNTSFDSLTRSKLTSASSTSNFHRPGTLPSYLGKPNQLNLESQLTEKQRKFVINKKKLVENQEQCKQQFSELAELNAKLSLMGGKQTKLEMLKLVYLVPSEDGSIVEKLEVDKEEKIGTCDQSVETENGDLDATLVDPVVQPYISSRINHSTLKMIADHLRNVQSSPLDFFTENFSNSLSNLLSEVSSKRVVVDMYFKIFSLQVSTPEDLPQIVSKLKNVGFSCEQQIGQAQNVQQINNDLFLEQLNELSNQNDFNDEKLVTQQLSLNMYEHKALDRLTSLAVKICEPVEIYETLTTKWESHSNEEIYLNPKAELEKLSKDHEVLLLKHDMLLKEVEANELHKKHEVQTLNEYQTLQQNHAMLIKTAQEEKNELCQEYQKHTQELNDAYVQLKDEFGLHRIEAKENKHKLSMAISEIDKVTDLFLIF